MRIPHNYAPSRRGRAAAKWPQHCSSASCSLLPVPFLSSAAVALVTCRKNNYQTPQNSMLLWPKHPATFSSRLLSLTRPHHTDHIILFEQPAQKLFRFLFLPHAFCMPPSGLSCRLFVPPSCLFPHSVPPTVCPSCYLSAVCLPVCLCFSLISLSTVHYFFAFIFDNFPRWICIFLCFLSAEEGRRKADFVAYLMSPPSCAFASRGDKLTPWNSGNHLQVVNTLVRRYCGLETKQMFIEGFQEKQEM